MGKVRRCAGMGVLMALVVGFLCLGLVASDAGVDHSGEKVGPLLKEIERLRAQVGKQDAQISVLEKGLTVLKEQEEEGGEKKALSKVEAELESMTLKVKQLEDQVVTATKQAEQAHRYAEALKKRAELAEESLRDLDAKYEKSQAAAHESKTQAKELEKALKMSEATISEAEKRLETHGEELSRVHNQWLPPWAASHVAVLQSRAKAKWASHAKPHVDVLYKHASDGAGAAHAFVKPHYDTVTGTVGPHARRHWKTVSDSVSPHVELIKSKTRDGYEVVRKDYVGKANEFLQPHFNTVVETGRPYVTLVQERTRPYVDHISTLSSSYAGHARNFVNPYVETVSPYYRSAVSAAAKHHENLQEKVRERLSKHESFAHVVTKELVWFTASALLAFPVVALLLIFSSALKKKPAPKRSSPPGSSAASGTKPKRAKKVDKVKNTTATQPPTTRGVIDDTQYQQ